MTTFDNVFEALDFIDQLAKKKIHAKLSNTLIEGVYDKRNVLVEGLYEWHVKQ